ncbi:MAG: hypothetical protein GX221_03405 [Candidatus Riflebacteria bacterium]|nr:hypothetical protein [Candidatus Riflebacteria bacterium]
MNNNQLASFEGRFEELKSISDSVHKLIQSLFDDKLLDEMIADGHETKISVNELNENFYRKEFQELWSKLNHKYAYKVSFDSNELIENSIKTINKDLHVAGLQYTMSASEQKEELTADAVREGDSFEAFISKTRTLKPHETSQVKYDLVGQIAQATVLTRRTVVEILKGIRIDKFACYKQNPEEFIREVSRLIKEQKGNMVVKHISYDKIDGQYDTSIFTADKRNNLGKAFRAKKHIQPYVFTDGTAEKSVERTFAEDLDGAAEVCVYAKLPRGFYIPTPVGNYTPDWAIAFHKGSVKHIYFIAETKGSMDSWQLREIEKHKIDCAVKLFNEISTENLVFRQVENYQGLLNIVRPVAEVNLAN